uniref:CRAL/TRIO N-terminal domain-containing protein n=1 Tax=Ananas comosus var. bracteatus TaxID=296719 RepID=A0A6V7NI02_ANACO|nr:unnamed protein product [Ananas comosus var. bracteatus]
MAEETQPTASEPTAQPKEVVVTEEAPPPPEEKAELTESAAAAEAEAEAMPQSVSFKEESNLVSDLADPEKKALDELKQLVAAALANNEFSLPPPPRPRRPRPRPRPRARGGRAPKPSEAPDEPPPKTTPQTPRIRSTQTSRRGGGGASQARAGGARPAAAASSASGGGEGRGARRRRRRRRQDRRSHRRDRRPRPRRPRPEAEEATETKTETKTEASAAAEAAEEEVRIWGVPIVGDERSDAVLLKFLRARDYKPAEAMAMLRSAVLWRKRFGIDALLDADLGLPEMDRVVFTRGADREGHPVCYNVYGEFQSKDLYDKAFGDDDKRDRFLKWRIQYLERGIRSQLDFSPPASAPWSRSPISRTPPPRQAPPGHAPGPHSPPGQLPRVHRQKAVHQCPVVVPRRESDDEPVLHAEDQEQVRLRRPFQIRGDPLQVHRPRTSPGSIRRPRQGERPRFHHCRCCCDTVLKPSSKQTIDIPVPENSTLVWEIRVLGWEVSYGAEFVPDAEDGYTVIVQKTRKLAASDEAVMKGTFKTGEAGKSSSSSTTPPPRRRSSSTDPRPEAPPNLHEDQIHNNNNNKNPNLISMKGENNKRERAKF